MKTSDNLRPLAVAVIALVGLLAGFQNCTPMLPLDGVVDASSLSVRATATPGSTVAPGSGSGSGSGPGSYSGSAYDGTCSNDLVAQPMAVTGTDRPGGALVAFTNTDGRAAFWNLASGALARGTVCSLPGNGWTVQAVADVDGDLNPDVIWRDASGNVVVWLMRGSTRISTALIGNMPLGWQLEGVGDFNFDGRADLVWRDGSGQVKLWLMNGTSAPTETAPFAVPLSSHLLGTSDFDGDRRNELFWRNDDSSLSLTAFDASLNSITQTFPSNIWSGYTIVGFGDFNGDLKTDLVVTRNSDGLLFLRYMNGTALIADSAAYAAPNTAWTFQFTRDVNGDGLADWIWTINTGTATYLAFTPVSLTPGSTSSFPVPMQSGFSLLRYPHH